MIEQSLKIRSGSSEDAYYTIRFTFNEDNLHDISCECRGFDFGDFCKHLRSFFENDSKKVYNPEDRRLFHEISAKLGRTHAADWFSDLETELEAIDEEKKSLAIRMKAAKTAFMKKLSGILEQSI